MGDPRSTDAEHDMLIDVRTTMRGRARVNPTRCRATAKRIYTIGGAVFERATGRWITTKELRADQSHQLEALPGTLRPAQEKAK